MRDDRIKLNYIDQASSDFSSVVFGSIIIVITP